ncbi:nucleotidyltransferase domain-containing protein [Sulfolobus tengchongensis]|uniref:Nucleotidyltransferase domain-containing protein n=1 Tax=Sulfolobus tengchongensis TaxID=207809 RepID=A0AAX4L466_9CREN
MDIKVLDKLKQFSWNKYGVLYAILFGSLAKIGKGRDVDIAVEFEEYNVDIHLRLLNDLQDYLGTELIDLVIITDDTSCYLIHEIFNNTRLIYLRDDKAWFKMNNRINICEDFLIDARKLNEIENAVLAVMRRWKE